MEIHSASVCLLQAVRGTRNQKGYAAKYRRQNSAGASNSNEREIVSVKCLVWENDYPAELLEISTTGYFRKLRLISDSTQESDRIPILRSLVDSTSEKMVPGCSDESVLFRSKITRELATANLRWGAIEHAHLW